jgi:DnaJ-class molecular chaperone
MKSICSREKECRKCRGTGALRRTCETCYGTGEPWFGADCDDCQGSGRVLDDCEHCDGRGVIDPDGVPRVL